MVQWNTHSTREACVFEFDYHHTVRLFLEDNDPCKRRKRPTYPSKPWTYYDEDSDSRSWAYSPIDDEYYDYIVHI